MQVGDEVRIVTTQEDGKEKKSDIGQVTQVEVTDGKETVTVSLPDGKVWTGDRKDVKYEYQPVCGQAVVVSSH